MKKFLSVGVATIIAASSLSLVAFAEDLVISKDNCNLTKVSDPTAAVKFTSDTYSGIVGGEDNGQWLIGGDNGDIGISFDMLKDYTNLEVDYTCDNPIEGVMIGLAFKTHISVDSRTDDSDGPIFNDYLPATWVPYGPQGTEGKGMTYNALETIYQTEVQASGTISIPVATLLDIFDDDCDYLMGIGFGANNNGENIPEDAIDYGEEYNLVCEAIKLTGYVGTTAEDTAVADEVVAEDTAVVAEDTAATDATTASAGDTTAVTADKASPNTGVEGVAAIAGIGLIATGIAVISSKKFKK